MRHGASAVIFSKNKILLFHRDNKPEIPFPNTWQLPGGQIEDGETPLEALRRELSEEVTYVPKHLIPIGYYENISGNNYIYLAFINPDEERLFVHRPEEGQEIGFFTLDEAININLTPPLRWFIKNKRNEIEKLISTKKASQPEMYEMKKI